MTSPPALPPAFVDLSGFRMAYREWGSPDTASAIVLIHGVTGSSLSWIRVGPRLAGRHRVLAVDLKGHGDSGRPPSGYRIADQAQEVAAFCAALGLERPAVVGHSWGGAIALRLATSTELVERLVLEDPAVGQRDPEPSVWSRAEESFTGWMGLAREEAEKRANAYLADGWSPEDVAGKIDAATRGSPAAVRSIFAENGPWSLHDALPALACPTLLVHAAPQRGGIVDSEALALALARANRSVRLCLVPQADHNIHRATFDAFMDLVEPFLADEVD